MSLCTHLDYVSRETLRNGISSWRSGYFNIKSSQGQIRFPQTPLATSKETGGLNWSVGPRALEVRFPSSWGFMGSLRDCPAWRNKDSPHWPTRYVLGIRPQILPGSSLLKHSILYSDYEKQYSQGRKVSQRKPSTHLKLTMNLISHAERSLYL